MPALPLPVKLPGIGDAAPAPAPLNTLNVPMPMKAAASTDDAKYEAQRKVTEKFGNFKAAVSTGRDKTSSAAALRNERYKVFGQHVDGCSSQTDREAAAVAFLEREKAIMRAQRKHMSTEDFQPICVLGQGAFGVVHLVQRKGTEHYFALKQMKKSRYQKKNYRDRAYAERDVLAAARTRWFVQLLATFQDTDHVFMVMEFVQGGELLKYFELKDRFTIEETKFYMAELLEALDTVHRCGFVHRDVKPDNIVLTAEGHLKLLDFGLCKPEPKDDEYAAEAAKYNTGSGDGSGNTRRARMVSRVGTPQYMSPEAFAGEAQAPSDIWALGIVMFEALYGGVPFHAGNKEGQEAILLVAQQVKEHARTFPKRLAKAKSFGFMPPDAEHLLLKIICPEPLRADAQAIRLDPFFEGTDFANIHTQTPPILPKLTGPTDTAYFDSPKKSQALPRRKAGAQRDQALEWAHYEFDRELCELERPEGVAEVLNGI
eukprot:CAMPEP_0206426208 /NCGR_PEP_ID=MMETSP0324_2-20121206/4235_1 /ASSEMBLY_ACC=CAM_ASM_000836 /TAXON_ID=2866 /ORGANISM="Crypthecodinium cohnii, Strain Seligo" /LENGTH=485 /DNA_ID=CAMNT_0053891107 /DNA_START=100 /DNA_END=1557 /DNA_ORIENTATION=+